MIIKRDIYLNKLIDVNTTIHLVILFYHKYIILSIIIYVQIPFIEENYKYHYIIKKLLQMNLFGENGQVKKRHY